ncbi:SdpA family antimicrobial peptide system protein [Sungkyunkwania multivorans]|uniref:SdpA family antimicrobial peptide system protein n=1 Tax=Sungkyunkwania multivorans TaxID=1173618 RepID=A0ABW3CZB4_9FLAO
MNVKWFFIGTLGLTISLIAYTLIIFIKGNPISLRYNMGNKMKVKTFVSQGFSFFTKDPKTEVYRIYSKQNGYVEAIPQSNFSAGNYFGASRKRRLVEAKLEIIFGMLDSTDYVQPKIALNEFLSSRDSLPTIVVEMQHDFLCEEYYIVKSKPEPWPLFSRKVESYYPYQICKLVFKCPWPSL